MYAGITALGFAATENFFYIYTYGYREQGLAGILSLFLIRVILVGWQHPFFTMFTGIGLAGSLFSRGFLAADRRSYPGLVQRGPVSLDPQQPFRHPFREERCS